LSLKPTQTVKNELKYFSLVADIMGKGELLCIGLIGLAIINRYAIE
jgi:hypothetical protein